MKRSVLWWIVAVCAVALWGTSLIAQSFNEPPPPSSAMRISPDLAEIVEMVRSKTPDDQIISALKLHPRLYDLTRSDAENLRQLGVSSTIISSIRAHDKALLRVWKKEAKTLAGTNPRRSLPKFLPPKLQGGNPATDFGTPMRNADTPVVWLTPPEASTEESYGTYTRPWTSSIIVEEAPPPPKLEVTPESPGADYIWIPGNWAWEGGTWVWESGRWIHRPPGAVWMNGSWQPHARGWIWIPGRWR